MTGSRRLELWPDCGGALLHDGGVPGPLAALPVQPDVVDRATRWLAEYDDAKADATDPDEAWLAEGRALFEVLRASLAAHDIVLFDWEGLWAGPGEP